jgi:hypothetical protein
MNYCLWSILILVILSGCDPVEKIIPIDKPYDDSILYEPVIVADTARFHFIRELYGNLTTLNITVESLNKYTGRVLINGYDSREPQDPFTFNWGDGTTEDGFFPQDHFYEDPSRNYMVTVSSDNMGSIDSAHALVRFLPGEIIPVFIPPEITVSIPDHPITLGTRLYDVSGNLTYFSDEDFTHMSREDLEYVLSVAAWIQYEFVNRNVYLVEGAFNQVVIKNPDSGGYGSLWFTNPPSFICDDFGLQGCVEYLGLFHESGHGFTLNTPADYYYGGQIDGSANAIYSESMAVIFSLAATAELLNHYESYGIPYDLAFEIYLIGKADFAFMTEQYRSYLSGGKRFTSWNDYHSESDDTFTTFLTIAYRFCYHAEKEGMGYMVPAQRMMNLLQVFNPDLATRYDRRNNSPEADTFRSTLFVSALSYAFEKDLREEFLALNFPISDETFDELLGMVGE